MSNKTKSFRGSAAPLAMACPASVNAPHDEIQIDSVNPAADLGTAVHEVAALIVKNGCIPDDWQQTCRRYGLDGAQIVEARFLIYAALDFWKTNGTAFKNPQTEYPLYQVVVLPDDYEFSLSCHLDVFSIDDEEAPTEALELDWKSTRLDVNYTHQMLFYAWCICLKYPSVQKVTSAVVYLRDRTANIQEWNREQVLAFGKQFTRDVVFWDGKHLTFGAHCSYCRRFSTCSGHKQLVAATRDEIATLEGFGTDLLTAPQVVALHQRLSVFTSMAEKIKDHIRACVEQAGGYLPGDNGKALKLIPQSRDKIDARLAWPIMHEVLTDDEIAPALTVSKGTLLDAIADHAPRGTKTKAKKDFMVQLNEVGAVRKIDFSMLRLVNMNEKENEIGAGSEN